jgi:hypothetical protein
MKRYNASSICTSFFLILAFIFLSLPAFAKDFVSAKQIKDAVDRGHGIQRHADKDEAFLMGRGIEFASSFSSKGDLYKAAKHILTRSAKNDFKAWVDGGCRRRTNFTASSGVKGYGISAAEADSIEELEKDIAKLEKTLKKTKSKNKIKKLKKDIKGLDAERKDVIRSAMRADLGKATIVLQNRGGGNCRNNFEIVTIYPTN